MRGLFATRAGWLFCAVSAGALLAAPAAGDAPVVGIRQAQPQAGTAIGTTRIVVDGGNSSQ